MATPKPRGDSETPPDSTTPADSTHTRQEADGQRSEGAEGAADQVDSQAHSHIPRDSDQTIKDADIQNREGVEGAVTPGRGAGDSAGDGVARESRAQATNRWIREGRRWEVDRYRRDRIRQGVSSGMTRSAAGDYAWECALRRFAAEPEPEPEPEPSASSSEPEPAAGLTGLADIPADWPDLPANASLQSEVSWVQANRVRCVQGQTVLLARALSAAPSHASLAWLETAVMYPSKWADVAARATAQQADEQEHVRRERKSIEELRSILAEMAPRCPHCGELLT